MGKGTELDDRWRERESERAAAIARGEYPANYRPRPELRVKADTPSLEVDPNVLMYATPSDYGVALRDPDGEIRAMMVPLDRYVEMASATIAADSHTEVAEGQFRARPGSLAALHVEQVDPAAQWLPGATPTQHLGNPNKQPE